MNVPVPTATWAKVTLPRPVQVTVGVSTVLSGSLGKVDQGLGQGLPSSTINCAVSHCTKMLIQMARSSEARSWADGAGTSHPWEGLVSCWFHCEKIRTLVSAASSRWLPWCTLSSASRLVNKVYSGAPYACGMWTFRDLECYIDVLLGVTLEAVDARLVLGIGWSTLSHLSSLFVLHTGHCECGKVQSVLCQEGPCL